MNIIIIYKFIICFFFEFLKKLVEVKINYNFLF